MIEDFYLNAAYWFPVLCLTLAPLALIRAQFLDFDFFLFFLLSQYLVHSSIAFGVTNEITFFCLGFYLVYFFSRKYQYFFDGDDGEVEGDLGDLLQRDSAKLVFEKNWVLFSKLFLVFYYCVRLVVYPYQFGELLLDDRLSAQQDNKLIFFLGLVVVPAIASCMYSWVRARWRLTVFDYVVIFITLVGLMGSGSKTVLLPFALAYFGVVSYLKIPLGNQRVALIGIAVLVVVTLYIISIFFPLLDSSLIGDLLARRLASNTDSLEYLKLVGLSPSDFPYAGIGGLFPMISKQLGYIYDFAPGVWLHGSLYGNWTGFGPNPGIVMDYFANIGWFGLVFAAIFGWIVRSCSWRESIVGCAFMSTMPIAFSDFSMLFLAFVFWGAVWIAVKFWSDYVDNEPLSVVVES